MGLEVEVDVAVGEGVDVTVGGSVARAVLVGGARAVTLALGGAGVTECGGAWNKGRMFMAKRARERVEIAKPTRMKRRLFIQLPSGNSCGAHCPTRDYVELIPDIQTIRCFRGFSPRLRRSVMHSTNPLRDLETMVCRDSLVRRCRNLTTK